MANADAHGDAGTFEDSGAQLPAHGAGIRNAGQVGKGLIDAVHLHCRHHGLDQAHDALAHVAIQRIVR